MNKGPQTVRHAHLAPSFAYEAKNEICQIVPTEPEARAELAAMTLAIGVPTPSNTPHIRYTTENLGVARRIVRIVREQIGLPAKVSVSAGIRNHNMYTVTTNEGRSLLGILGIRGTIPAHATLPKEYIDEAVRAAVVRGAFLAAGSISNPHKNYHAELVVSSESFAHSLQGMLSESGISANIFPRKEHFVLYLNEGDSVAALLALAGAHSSILKLENVRILKETRNNVNRAVNCVTANISKAVEAAQKQIDSIRLIEERAGLETLSATLFETAQLRLENPEATLQDLCELAGTSKSCMNHRLRKINAIARALSEEEDGNDLQGTCNHERGRT